VQEGSSISLIHNFMDTRGVTITNAYVGYDSNSQPVTDKELFYGKFMLR